MLRRPRESTIQNRCVEMIRADGWWAEKIHVDAMQSRGLPDVVACMAGTFYGIEFKRSFKKPSDMQKYQIGQIRRAGGRAGVIDSVEKMRVVLMEVKTGMATPYLHDIEDDDEW